MGGDRPFQRCSTENAIIKLLFIFGALFESIPNRKGKLSLWEGACLGVIGSHLRIEESVYKPLYVKILRSGMPIEFRRIGNV
jgi:hypothetical protein